MSTAKRVVKNTAFLYVKMFLTIGINFFTTRVLLQALGVSDYGIYSVVGGVISMLGFLSASMSSTTQRYLNVSEGANDTQHMRKVFANAIIIHKVLAFAVIVLLSIAGIFFFNGILSIPENRLLSSIIVYACMIFSTSFSVTIAPYDGSLNAHEDLHVFSIIGILDCFLKFMIAIAIQYSSTDRLILYGILIAIESWFLRYITKRYCCKKYVECKKVSTILYFDKCLIKEMVRFAGWNFLTTSSAMITLYSMSIIINHYYGLTYNAAMGVATQLTGVLMAFSLNMQKAISPAIMKHEGANNRGTALFLTYEGAKFAFIIFAIIGFPVYFCIDWILELWLTDVPKYTNVFCRLLLFSILIEQYFVIMTQTIMAQGQIKQYCIYKSIVNILPVFTSILLCLFNMNASWVVVNRIIFYVILGGIVNVFFCKLNIGLSVVSFIQQTIIPTLIPALGIFICSFFFIKYTHLNGLIEIFILMLISVIIFYFFSINKFEKKILKKHFRL